MIRVKLLIVLAFIAAGSFACLNSRPNRFVVAESRLYEASLFRQNCAVCHGPEGEGKTLDDGTKVPSLREGEFKFKTAAEVYNQIANGGNGMVPHRYQLTERELRLLTKFVIEDLRQK